jgi:3D (Asp-Asp-Asp) domain-containing protein
MPTDDSNVILKSRITYYSVGEDKWGDLVACPKTPRAKEGITVAAHPDFPFGTKIKIPSLSGIIGDGIFIVQDRGSAVTKKKASKGKCHVFDVFVKTKKIMHKHANKNNMYMDVYVLEE